MPRFMYQNCDMMKSDDYEHSLKDQAKTKCCGKIVAIFICMKCFHVMPEKNSEHYVDCCKDNSEYEIGKLKMIELMNRILTSTQYQEQLQNELKLNLTDMAIQSKDSNQGMNLCSLKPAIDFEEMSLIHDIKEDKSSVEENKVIKEEELSEEPFEKHDENPCLNINKEKVKPICLVCSKSFSRKSTLAIHERIHRGEKPYLCQFCSKCFTCDTTLRRHEMIHTGERPFQCKFCSKSFTQSVHLKSHETIHNKTIHIKEKTSGERHKSERLFSCSVCSKSYPHRSSLTLHKRFHTGEKPFSCKYCYKSFAIRPKLTLHERIHTGEKPYSCKFCSKSFSDRSSKVKHERIHTGEKPFLCQFCSRSFSDRTTFVRHERIHKRDK